MSETETTTTQTPGASADRDLEHLRLLSIFYYVFAGLNALGLCGAGAYLVFGIGGLIIGPENLPDIKDDEVAIMRGMAWLFTALGCGMTLVLIISAVLLVWCGYSLQNQRNITLCYVVGVLSCLSVPLGTILGIFTFIVLARPSVKAKFERNRLGLARTA